MKNQALFSSKDKSKKLKCRLLQFLSGVLRVKKLFPFESDRKKNNLEFCLLLEDIIPIQYNS